MGDFIVTTNDMLQVTVPPPFVTPGMGTLTVMLPTNLSQKTVQGKPMLLKGPTR